MKIFKYISKTCFEQLFSYNQIMISKNKKLTFQSCDWFYASESIIESSGRKELQEFCQIKSRPSDSDTRNI